MQQYNILQAIYMSFYSRDLYRDVAKNWGGKAYIYLLLVVALAWIGITYQLQMELNRVYREKSDSFVNQVPTMTIKQGKIETPENRPYFIVDPETKEQFAIIDTSGKYTDVDNVNVSLLVTKDKIISRNSPQEIKTYELPKTLNAMIDARVINGYVKKFIGFSWILAYVFFVIVGYIYRIIQTILYSIIGKIVAGVTKTPLSFGQTMQITMVAITPALILATVLDLLRINFLHQLLFYFLLSMVYLCYGIVANKNH